MVHKFWTKEREAEVKRLGDAFWTPDNIRLYREAINFTMEWLTGHIPCPNVLPKIRYRDLVLGDVIYYRNKYKTGQYNGGSEYKYTRFKIIGIQRLFHKNQVLITYMHFDTMFNVNRKYTMTVHGKNSTRLLGSDKK